MFRFLYVLCGLWGWLLLIPPHLAYASSAEVGGYLRIMTRPDFQGGHGQLGHWNLYGRLLNEGPWAALETRLHLLEQEPGSDDVWTFVHAKIEGGSVAGADEGNGSLGLFRLRHLYVQTGNIGLKGVTWQLGTLETWMGDLGLYDMRPTTLFSNTIGLSARYVDEKVDALLAIGDSGYGLDAAHYNTVLTVGGRVRYRPIRHVEFGVGGEYFYEPSVEGNIHGPYNTPGVAYEDYLRGEVVENWLSENPGQGLYFPDPEPTDGMSFKVVGYFGFGDLGPLVWNSLFASYGRLHPEHMTTETVNGSVFDLYIRDLTDERYFLMVGNEMQLQLWPERLDLVWSALYGFHDDVDNTLAPSSHNRTYASSVLRLQAYPSPLFHLIFETSIAREQSANGNQYRNHADSVFGNVEGISDSRGLEMGDSNTRDTWQGKAGVVVNPMGPGVYVRPSLRLIYGVQYSTENNAFGNSFVETVDQYNDFGNVERHWHHVLALETEVWF